MKGLVAMNAWGRWSARLGAVALAAMLAGCQTMPGLSVMGGADIPLAGPLPPPEPRQWPDADADVLNARARNYGLVDMPEMQKYLNGLLARIKTAAGVPDWPGQVYVLAAQPLDAYASAAGNVYVSWSWLASAQSEDEIVALLSHEYGHVYLHYHQLEGAVRTTDTVASLASLTVALVKDTAKQTGWTAVDSLAAGYVMSREVISSAWGRSQEAAADSWGAHVSTKLGYSFGAGYQAFFERVISWEAENAERQTAQRKALLEQVKAQAAQSVRAAQTGQGAAQNLLAEPMVGLSQLVDGALHQGTVGLGDLWKTVTSSHPDTVGRLESLAVKFAELPAWEDPEPITKPWDQARRQRRTAALLDSYRQAYHALGNLEDPKALEAARAAAKGPAANHAVPLKALYSAQMAAAAKRGNTRGRQDPLAPLDRNLGSERDRTWLSVTERAEQLYENGRREQARQVMARGFEFFRNAGEAWPAAVSFYGRTAGWDEAQRMAQECRKRFASYAQACADAARSPAERQRAEQDSKKKSKQIVDGWFK